jgi:hypothetical protein
VEDALVPVREDFMDGRAGWEILGTAFWACSDASDRLNAAVNNVR